MERASEEKKNWIKQQWRMPMALIPNQDNGMMKRF
jgi:hypothetical protein